MPACLKSVIVLFVASCIAPAADPVLVSYIPPGTKVVAGANLSQFIASPFGRFIVAQAQASQPQLKQLAATGFDPLRDLQEVLVASSGDRTQNQGLVLVKGIFSPSALAEAVKSAGTRLQDFNGVQVLAGKQPNEMWMAFLDNATAAVGDPASVKGAIGRRGAGRGPEPSLRAKIDQASATYDFWAVSTAPVAELAGKMPDPQLEGMMQGDLLKGVLETSFGVKFGADILVAMEAVTRSEKDATALADVIRFFIGMAQMSAQKDPRAANSMAVLQRLQLTAQGNTTKMSLTVPGAELEKFIQQAQATVKKQTSPPSPKPAEGGLRIQSSPRDMGNVTIK